MLDTKTFNQEYLKGYSGYIEIVYQLFKDDILAVSSEHYFHYDNTTQLWKVRNRDGITEYIYRNINKIYDYIDKSTNTDQFIKKTTYSKINRLIPKLNKKILDSSFCNKMDNKKGYLPVENGNINLKTGILEERVKEDYFTFNIDVEWKGLDYPTDTIDKFIHEIMDGDGENINKLQQLLGYSITGYNDAKIVMIFDGNRGSNGKSTLTNLLLKILNVHCGQYSEHIVKSIITTNKDVWLLHRARPGIVQWPKFKNLTQGQFNKITNTTEIISKYHKMKFDYTTQLILSANNTIIKDHNGIVKIPFPVQFMYPSEIDHNNPQHKPIDNLISDKLNKKLDEFLVWLVKGSVNYFK